MKLFSSYFRRLLCLRARMAFEGSRRRKLAELVSDHVLGHIDRQMTFAVVTPKVKPTISGVIVERRDQVLIAGGRALPARIRSTAFAMLLSTNAPFLTERAIIFRFAPFKFQVPSFKFQEIS